MTRPLATLLLLASLTLLFPRVLPAEGTTGSTSGENAKKMTRPEQKEKKSQAASVPITREDREVVKNLDLLERMKLLQDMDVLTASTEKKK